MSTNRRDVTMPDGRVLSVHMGRKKRSIADELARLPHLDPDHEDVQQFNRDMEVAKRREIESRHFRYHSETTQAKQDQTLRTYYAWFHSKHQSQLPENPSEEDLDRFAFPPAKDENNYEDLVQALNLFMVHIVLRIQPRSMLDEPVAHAALAQYRTVLLFWVDRKFTLRGDSSPPKHIVYDSMTKSIRSIVETTQMKLERIPKSKRDLGLVEILQLIDLDSRDNPDIELSQYHQLAWLIAGCCALRPDALGAPSRDRQDPNVEFQYPIFRDVSITRSEKPGHFDLALTLREFQVAFNTTEETGYHLKEAVVCFKTPEHQHSLMTSIPHRFLALALRRGALENYTTVEELLSDHRQNVVFKEEFQTKPFLLAGTYRGLDAKRDEPISAAALCEYVKIRGMQRGCNQSISFYSICRRVGTELIKLLGQDGARSIMRHNLNTDTLGMFPLSYTATIGSPALTDLGIGEAAQDEHMEVTSRVLAISKLEPTMMAKTHGKVLNAAFRLAVAGDDVHARCKTPQERRDRERVLRRSTLHSLIAQIHEEQNENIANADYVPSKTELLQKATEFRKRVVERIKSIADTLALSQMSSEADKGGRGSGDFDFDFDQDFEERDSDKETEADLEDQLGGEEGTQSSCLVAEKIVEKDPVYSQDAADHNFLVSEIPYKNAVHAFMTSLMETKLS